MVSWSYLITGEYNSSCLNVKNKRHLDILYLISVYLLCSAETSYEWGNIFVLQLSRNERSKYVAVEKSLPTFFSLFLKGLDQYAMLPKGVFVFSFIHTVFTCKISVLIRLCQFSLEYGIFYQYVKCLFCFFRKITNYYIFFKRFLYHWLSPLWSLKVCMYKYMNIYLISFYS